jgi:hypothetical protein
MTPHRILRMNALFTAIGAAGLLAARPWTPPLFGLDSPALLDAIAVASFLYAGVVALLARGRAIDRRTMLTFAIADTTWVVGSAIVLLLFWSRLAPLGRALIIAVAVAVDLLAMLQFRAAGHAAVATTSSRAALL